MFIVYGQQSSSGAKQEVNEGPPPSTGSIDVWSRLEELHEINSSLEQQKVRYTSINIIIVLRSTW